MHIKYKYRSHLLSNKSFKRRVFSELVQTKCSLFIACSVSNGSLVSLHECLSAVMPHNGAAGDFSY